MIPFKRVLLKLSGESLMGTKKAGIDENRLSEYAAQIKAAAALGVQMGKIGRAACRERV